MTGFREASGRGGAGIKTSIYYFSGTGNSLVVARDIAAGIEGAEIVAIPTVAGRRVIEDAGRIGIVYPVYIFGLPLIVADFAANLGARADAYIFSVATYGGTPGNANGQLKKALARRGLKLAAAFGIAMPGNYTPLYGAIPESKQRDMFAREKEEAAAVVGAVVRGDTGVMAKSGVVANAVLSGILYKAVSKRLRGMDRRFRADDKCNSCGLCAKVCPVNNIEMADGKPRWLGWCEQCMACLQWCPVEAIQFGSKTEGRVRYRHPETSAGDFVLD